MGDPPRAQSTLPIRPSTFQFRASQVLKKVAKFRVRVSTRRRDTEDTDEPYERQVRSMDGSPKPYTSQPCLALRMPGASNTTDTDDSSLSISSANSPSRQSGQIPPDSTPTFSLYKALPQRPRSPDKALVKPKSRDGIPRETMNGNITGPPSKFEGLPNIVVSDPPLPPSRVFGNLLPAESRRPRDNTNAGTSPNRLSSPLIVAPSSAPSQPTPGMSSSSVQRPHVPQLEPLPSPSLRFHAQGDLLLSPSIIYRPPIPLRNLPTLPPLSPAVNPPLNRVPSRRRLRTMPALPREGTNDDDRDSDPDHEHSELGDSEDDDDAEGEAMAGDGGSDDDDLGGDAIESTPASTRSSISSRQRPLVTLEPLLPIVDDSPLGLSFHDNTSIAGPSDSTVTVGEKTPKARQHFDYFSDRSPELDFNHSPSRTPRALEGKFKPSGAWRTSQMGPIPGPSSEVPMRPGIHRHASKSMINLGLGKDPITAVTPIIIIEEDAVASVGKGKGKARESSQVIDQVQDTSQSHTKHNSIPSYDHPATPSLARRRSMPTFNPATAPPPYPSFAHPMQKSQFIQPRDDEGKEQLPLYSNSIYVQAIMPRKMEFSSPGVQAKDRKWRRVLCILEGTAFKVYKCPSGASGAGLITEWWEDKVGVGDASLNTEAPPKKTEPEKLPKWERERMETQGGLPTTKVYVPPSASSTSLIQAAAAGPSKSKLNLAATLLKPSAAHRSHIRSRSDLSVEAQTVVASRRHRSSPSSPLPSTSHPSAGTNLPSTTTLGSPGSVSSLSSRQPRILTRRYVDSRGAKLDLIRAYTLQHAESGLGNDYQKRKNVIRVRMEGEQFLLQASDVAGVVEWIEAIHAATNVALDLDQRTMPKGPLFPRRRRRRRRADGGHQIPSDTGPLPASPT